MTDPDAAHPPAERRRRRWWPRLRLTAAAAAVSALVAGCSPLTSLNDLFVSREGYTLTAGIAYGPESRHMLDVYVPETLARPAKVVVFLYGGAWRGGNRGYYRFVGQALSAQGAIVVVPDYRVYPEVQFPAFVEDAALALRWVQDNIGRMGGDADDLWLIGHSAGAHIAALLITDDRYLAAEGVARERVQGFVGLAGPYAIDPLRYRTTRPAFAGLTEPDPAQPIAHVDGDEPPMLLLHGGDDGTVWPINSHAFADRVKAAGGRAEVVEYPEIGHIGLVLALSEAFRGSGAVFRDTVRFLDSADPAPPTVARGDAAAINATSRR